jgi:hypothetical protein
MNLQEPFSIPPPQFATPGTVMVRPLLLKPQWMNGLSERLLVSHYVNNYGGALRRLNAITARLAVLDWSRTSVFEINGLKREDPSAARRSRGCRRNNVRRLLLGWMVARQYR